jgi:hypothetical protein
MTDKLNKLDVNGGDRAFLLNRRIAAWSFEVGSTSSMPASAGLFPESVEDAAQERIPAGSNQIACPRLTLTPLVVRLPSAETAGIGAIEPWSAVFGTRY